ncbi:MAG: universal stress protein [Chloroflexi bacterium]|nr:universal stress protein [Chloroflexota bacterium]MBU1660887.1 universal stress protein [Chloroflexota bacterium]
MTSKKIRHIICAVRGVPKSRDTVTKAIDLALEHNARLTFAHVSDAEFLSTTRPSMISLRSVYKQLHDLGEFTMSILKDRAERSGVSQADYIVREGKLLKQLRLILAETCPDVLVIGKPVTKGPVRPSVKTTEFEQFVTDVETQLNIQVVIVEIDVID